MRIHVGHVLLWKLGFVWHCIFNCFLDSWALKVCELRILVAKFKKKGIHAVLVVCLMSGISMRKKDVKNNLGDNIQNNVSFFFILRLQFWNWHDCLYIKSVRLRISGSRSYIPRAVLTKCYHHCQWSSLVNQTIKLLSWFIFSSSHKTLIWSPNWI